MENTKRINITEEELLFSSVSREELALYDTKAAYSNFLGRIDRARKKRRHMV